MKEKYGHKLEQLMIGLDIQNREDFMRRGKVIDYLHLGIRMAERTKELFSEKDDEIADLREKCNELVASNEARELMKCVAEKSTNVYRDQRDTLGKELYQVRKYLWLIHGHIHCLYGDDGELQCSHHSHGILDFKRDPIGKILDRLTPQPADSD